MGRLRFSVGAQERLPYLSSGGQPGAKKALTVLLTRHGF